MRSIVTAMILVAPLGGLPLGCEREPAAPEPAASSGGGETGDAAGAPSAPGPRQTGTVTSATGSFTARWSMPDPIPEANPFTLEVELFADTACTVPLDGETCRIDAAMPHHGHGMNVAPRMRREGPGRWKAAGMLLHMPGRWELFIDVERDGLVERAQATVVLP